MAAVLIILFLVFFLMPGTLESYLYEYIEKDLARLAELKHGTPGAADVSVALKIMIILGVLWGYFFILMLWVALVAGKMWRAPQWPLPGTLVIYDTRIQRGVRLKAKALLLMIIPLIMIAVVSRPVIHMAFNAWEIYTVSYAELKKQQATRSVP